MNSQDTKADFAHTPGPWQAQGIWVHSEDESDFIARCLYAYDMPFGVAKANARLIAAAPRLLAELTAAVRMLGKILPDDDANLFSMREAISRATGSEGNDRG